MGVHFIMLGKKTTNRVSSVSELSLCLTAGFCA
jgi:hypothetical protein